MTKIIDVIGLLGSIMVGVSLFPQTIKTIKTIKEESNNSISLSFLSITFTSSILMSIFAIYYMIIPMLIANILVFINTLILLIVIIKKNNIFSN
tara:strand:- start:497 stop:778 length:282 start_codon:yes stop_codon:yes gene_type:complete